MPTTKALVAPRRLLALTLLLAGIATASGGCIVVPVGGHGGGYGGGHGGGYGGPRHRAVIVPFLPLPGVVVRPYRAW